MTLICIYKTTYITWLPFKFSVPHHLSRMISDVICIMRLWLIVRYFSAKFLMKLNAPDDLFPNEKTFLTPF